MDNNNSNISAFIIPKPIQDLPEVQGPTLIGNLVVEENGEAKRLSSDKINRIINTGISGDLDKVTSVPTTGYYKYDVFVAKTYTNVSPNITVSPTELKNNVVYVVVDNGVAYKVLQEKLSPDVSDLVTKEEFDPVKETVDKISISSDITLTFDRYGFNSGLSEIVDSSFVNCGAIVRIDWKGVKVKLKTNCFGSLWCGWKDSLGNILGTFQADSTGTIYINDAPNNAYELYVSRFGGFTSSLSIDKRNYASIETEYIANNAFNRSEENKTNISLLEKYTGYEIFYPKMTSGSFYNIDLVLTPFGDITQYAEIDVTGLEGVLLDVYILSHDAAYCGFVNSSGAKISVFNTGVSGSAYEVEIPKGASKMLLSNYDVGTVKFKPYFVVRKGDKIGLDLYTRQFNYTTLGSFMSSLMIGKSTPINMGFLGNSITNRQSTGDNTNYPVDSLNRPFGMYNKNTFPYKSWQLLNPGSYNDYTNTLVNEFGNIGFVKFNNTSVVKNGDWVSNYDNNQYNSLGTYFSEGNAAINEFFHSKSVGDSAVFNVPSGAKGFSIVGFKFNGSKSYGGFESTASTMKIYIGSVLKDTVSLVGEELVYFDYTFDTPLTSATTIKIENAENKWLPVWGIEYWNDKCIRPVKLAISGSEIGSVQDRLSKFITNNNMDIVIHEAQLINEKNRPVNQLITFYDNYCKFVKEKNIPLVFLIVHRQRNVEQNLNTRAIMLMNILKSNNVPYINVWAYMDDKFNGGVIPNEYYYDEPHLSNLGNDVYFTLIKDSVKKKY